MIRKLTFAIPLALACSASAAEQPEYSVKMHLGRPLVHIDGKPQPLPAYSPIAWSKRPFVTQVPRFYQHRMGLYFLALPVLHYDLHGTQFWDGDRVSSEPLFTEPERKMQGFTSLDESVAIILKGDPGAHFMLRIGIAEPKTWRERHPHEYFITEEGQIAGAPSFASETYWATATKFCTAVVKHCESRPWANRLIGYANFLRTEGTHQAVIENWLYDHNPQMVALWRKFLKKKYGTIARLREAHGDPTLAFRTLGMPKDKLRGPTPKVSQLLYWQAPKDNQPLRDYLELVQQLFHQRFREICAAMRAGTDRKKIFVYDGLKQTMQGWNCGDFFHRGWSRRWAYPEQMSAGGSSAVAKLFDAPAFDGLLTPHDYQARAVGGVYEPEGIVDSCILRGKVFFCEMDTRTYAAKREKLYGKARDQREFEAVTWRNIASSLTRGYYSYWMDLYADWFSTEEIHKVIGRQVRVIKDSVDWPHETVPGIAMIIDDRCAFETNGNAAFLHDAVMWEWKTGMARCGVPYRIYLLDDLALEKFPEHKVFYFPNLFKVDEARLALLKRKVFRNGNVVLWGPGSGISDGKTIGPASAKRLTGFSFDMLGVNFPRRTLLSNFTHPITRGLAADTFVGGPLSYGPVLFPTDGERLAEAWTQNGADQAGLAVKHFEQENYTGVFTTSVPLPASLWRGLARQAGAHIYSETNDQVLASRHIVALHSLKTGPKRIALPEPCDVIDLVTGKTLGKNTREIRFQLIGPDTRVFRLVPVTGRR